MNTIIGLFAKPLGYLLLFFYNIIGNYGITLILVTVIIKTCLYPLYIKQMKSSMGTAEITKKTNQLKQKYANDKETLNKKIAEMYKEEGFNPAGGCLPVLIQMPILFGMFALFRTPMEYISDPEMLYAVHESFLWIPDLSQSDKWILPILAGISTFISFSISQKNSNAATADMGGVMKIMRYVFPLMIFLMGRTYSAGLALYWFFGQFLQIFFNLHMNTLKKKANDRKKAKGGKK
ncbi:MAG: YidC/Oxa1 family membrane protein insertase [Lachnospirales bacterium]